MVCRSWQVRKTHDDSVTRATFKLLAILETGNDAGGPAMTVERPA